MEEKENFIIPESALRAANVKIAVIPDKEWPEGKECPTQFNSVTNEIEVRESFAQGTDPEKWLVHETVHFLTHQEEKPQYADEKHPYPTNEVEQFAYTTQFYHLVKNGVSIEDIMNDPQFETLKGSFERHFEVLQSYFNDAINKLEIERQLADDCGLTM